MKKGRGGKGGAPQIGRRKRGSISRKKRARDADTGIVTNTKIKVKRGRQDPAAEGAAAGAVPQQQNSSKWPGGVIPVTAAPAEASASNYSTLLAQLSHKAVDTSADEPHQLLLERDDEDEQHSGGEEAEAEKSDLEDDDDDDDDGDDDGNDAYDDADAASTDGSLSEHTDNDDADIVDDGTAAEERCAATTDAVASSSAAKPTDSFTARFILGTLDEDEAEGVARAASEYVAVPELELAPSTLGLTALESVTVARALASGTVDCSHATSLVLDGSSKSRNAVPFLLPPAVDLHRNSLVNSKIAAAWSNTYGGEVQAIAARHAKANLRASTKKLLASDPPAAPASAKVPPQPFSPLQHLLWRPLNEYRDVYFAVRSGVNARELRTVATLHIVNHVMKAREAVQVHDFQVKAEKAAAKAAVFARRVAKGIRAVGGGIADGTAAEASTTAAVGSTAKPAAQWASTSLLESSSLSTGGDEGDASAEKRDQGFTRPRVLVLLPFRHSALAFVRGLIRLLPGRSIMNRNRFFREYSEEDSGLGAEYEDDESELRAVSATGASTTDFTRAQRQRASVTTSRRAQEMMSDEDESDADDDCTGEGAAKSPYPFNAARQCRPRRSPKHADGDGAAGDDGGGEAAGSKDKRPPAVQPLDYRRTFAGNIDDDFRLGIALRRHDVKLYADFYDSDILVASPVSLRRHIGGEGDKKRDFDFLSSIEVVLMDSVDVLLQQNWEHVRDVFTAINRIPTTARDTDFSRVREWNLAGLAKYFRQNIIFSAYVDPDVTALMRRHCANTLGGLIIRGDYAGSIARVIPPVKQQFHRVPAASLAGADDARLKFFTDRILPALLEAATGDRDGSAPAAHTAIYVPSYFDYVRVRNLLDAREAEFVTASEYTEDGDITRARARFFAGDSPLLVLTERFHYFRRLRIRGIRNIVFYAPPNVAHHYTEMLNMLGEACAASLPVSSLVMYTRYDSPALERVVGTERCSRLLEDGPKDSFVFV